MIIRSSSTPEVTRLLAALGGSDQTRREAAVARLSIIGQRAVGRLLQMLAATSSPAAKAGALRALEAIGDVRALDPARALTVDPDETVALAALALVSRHLRSADEAAGARALDTVTGTALDTSRPDGPRLAALAALDDMSRDIVEPVFAQLTGDPSRHVRERAVRGALPVQDGSASPLEDAAAGRFMTSPQALHAAIVEGAPAAPLPLLKRLVDALRARETSEIESAPRDGWANARAAVHQALAARRSRLALYDLRETFEQTNGPLPVGFLAALDAVGDGSCLDPIAGAWTRSNAPGDAWWRDHLRQAFQTIVRREGLTRRHRIIRRIQARWPDAVNALLTHRRTAG